MGAGIDLRRGGGPLTAAWAALALGAGPPDPAGAPALPRMDQARTLQIVEFDWTRATPHPAPFGVELRVDLRGPGGRALSLPAFHAGGRTWKARFLPTAEGDWSYRTVSRDPGLDGRTGRIRCLPPADPAARGPLRIDPADPARLAFEGGARPFFLGVECRGLWALDLGRPEADRLEAFLDRLRDRGFNWVVLAAYDPGSGGGPPLAPWPPDRHDFGRFDLRYWRHLDRVIEGLHHRGIVAHLQMRTSGRRGAWPRKRSPGDWRYYRHLAARYQAFPGLVWDFGPDAGTEPDLAYKVEVLTKIGAWDAYRHPRTIDDESGHLRGAYGFLELRSLRIRGRILPAVRAMRRGRRPIVALGYALEGGPGTAEPGALPSEEALVRSWRVAFAGAYPVAAAEGVSRGTPRPSVEPASWRRLHLLRDVLERAGPSGLRPAPELVRAGRALCLARPGRVYVLLLEDERHVTVRLRGIRHRLRAAWIDIETGARRDGGAVEDGDRTFHRPAAFRGPGAVLWIGPLLPEGPGTRAAPPGSKDT